MSVKALTVRDINDNKLHGNHVHCQTEAKQCKENGNGNDVGHVRVPLVIPEPKRFSSIHLNVNKSYDSAKDQPRASPKGSPEIAGIVASVSSQQYFYHRFPSYPYFPFGYPGYHAPVYPDYERQSVQERYLENLFGYPMISSFPPQLAQYCFPLSHGCMPGNQPEKHVEEKDNIKEEPPEDDAQEDTLSPKVKSPNKQIKGDVHASKEADTSKYPCSTCDKRYSTFGGLSKHKQFHCSQDSTKEFACKYCEKIYISLGALKMHVRTHTLPCKCKLCGKAFSRPWLLQGHVRTHTGEKPFTCMHCLRAFADRSNLRAHVQTHSDVKKYNCKACSKTFSRMSLLLRHELSCKNSTI